MPKVNKSRTGEFFGACGVAPMLCVADGDGEGIDGVSGLKLSAGQKDFDHVFHLVFFGMAVADHGFLNHVGCIFRHANFEQHGGQHHPTAGLAELQRGASVFVDEGFFDGGFIGLELLQHS